MEQFSLSIVLQAHKEIPSPNGLTEKERDLLSCAYDTAIATLGAHVKTIIHAYGFTDWEMNSALARPDVDPYEALLQGAKDSEMNHVQDLWPLIIDARAIWGRLDAEKEKAKL